MAFAILLIADLLAELLPPSYILSRRGIMLATSPTPLIALPIALYGVQWLSPSRARWLELDWEEWVELDWAQQINLDGQE